MYLKLSANQKLQISDRDAEKIKELLLDPEPPKFVKIEGQVIKTANIIGVFKDEALPSTFQKPEYHWSDKELEQFEDEIFGSESPYSTFEEYLISEGAWVINDRYPYGAVRNPEKYQMLTVKWNCLQDLRYRKEKAKGFPNRDKKIAQIKAGLAKLKDQWTPESLKRQAAEQEKLIKEEKPKTIIFALDEEHERKKKELLDKIPF